MKRSRSGTASRTSGISGSTVLLIAALAIVLAFAGSFIFGLRRAGTATPAPTPPDTAQSAVVHSSRGRIEVLNAAGTAGLARVATQRLRDVGFDVVQFGNAAAPQASSQVIDRVGNDSIAAAAGAALGITNISSVRDTARYVDATVILGKDWSPASMSADRKPVPDR